MASPTHYTSYRKLANIEGANALMVKVYYDKGGINYLDYSTDARGYYASVTPVTLAGPSTPGGFSSVSFNLFKSGGFKVFLKPVARLNGPALKALTDAIRAKAADVAAAYDNGEPNLAYEILAGFKAPELLQKEVA